MKNLLRTSLPVAALLLTASVASANHDLFISEYVEGTSNNKAIELYNPTGAPVDLTAGGYKLRVYSNGAAVATTTTALTGIVAAGGTFVIANPSASAVILGVANQTSGNMNFNGNDAVELVKNATNDAVDILGQIGFDPLTEWGAGLQSTQDNTLRRKPNVCEGDVIGSDLFDPTVEWDGFATDSFGDLGTHLNSCGVTGTSAPTWGSLKTLYR